MSSPRGLASTRARAKSSLFSVFAVALLAPSSAVAQAHAPGVWERAAYPDFARAEEAHRKVEMLLLDVQEVHWHTPMGQDQLARALQKLEEVSADESRDVRLRFDFGRVASLIPGNEKRAIPVLESALRQAPQHPAAIEAFFSLAICYAKLGRAEDELTAYDEYLRRETGVLNRANALSNRAEGQMLLGRLAPAVADYRASLSLQPDNVLAHWGLAVALDRSGDIPGAIAEARAAITYDPLDQQLGSPNVFFMPPYDRYWYEGVGAMARGEQVDDAATAILWWDTAIGKWKEYLAFASSDDRWVPLAKAHEAWCQKQLADAKQRAARASKGRRRAALAP